MLLSLSNLMEKKSNPIDGFSTRCTCILRLCVMQLIRRYWHRSRDPGHTITWPWSPTEGQSRIAVSGVDRGARLVPRETRVSARQTTNERTNQRQCTARWRQQVRDNDWQAGHIVTEMRIVSRDWSASGSLPGSTLQRLEIVYSCGCVTFTT